MALGIKTTNVAALPLQNRAIGLHTEINCSEFEEMDRVDVPLINFCSVALGEAVLNERMDVMMLAAHDVDVAVRHFVEVQKENNGFRIVGWSSAPKESEDCISDAKIMQVVSFQPIWPLTNAAKHARIKKTTNATGGDYCY